MAPTRRALLGAGVAGVALVALGGVGLSLQGTVMRAPARALKVLDAREYSILAAIVEALLPGGEGLADGLALAVPERVDDALATWHPEPAGEFRQVLRLMENAVFGFVFDQRVRPLSALPLERRARALDAWRTSAVPVRRAAFKAVCNLCNFAYWAQPETWPFVGYDGPPDFSGLTPTDAEATP